MGPAIELPCPAKVNLGLRVVGRRPDGYHDLDTVFQRVTLFDRLRLQLTETGGVELSCPDSELPMGEGNIAWRAARLLLDRAATSRGVSLTLWKSIPRAAGMGGGSSDAASVLLGLNRLLGGPLSGEELPVLGSGLGADVPFFLLERPAARGEGIGDRLTPVNIPPWWFVLVHPPFEASTAWVYRNLNLELTISRRSSIKNHLEQGSFTSEERLSNDLESVTFAAYPELGTIREALLSLGAVKALMSGSGPTMFGMFARRESAERTREALATGRGWNVRVVRSF